MAGTSTKISLLSTRAEHGITAFPTDGAGVIFTKSHSVEEEEAGLRRQTSKQGVDNFFFFVRVSIGRSIGPGPFPSFLPFFLCLFVFPPLSYCYGLYSTIHY